MSKISFGNPEPRWMAQGVVMTAREDTPLTLVDYKRICLLCDQIPTSPVILGDTGETHALEVGRFKTDVPEPKHLSAASRQIEGILLASVMQAFYQKFLGRVGWNLQRLQLNILRTGGLIGAHVDQDSDPRRQIAMVFHLSDDYEGGVFVILDPDGVEQRFRPPPGTLLFSRGDLLHSVEPVTRGERRTLAGFLFSGQAQAFAALSGGGRGR